MAEEVKSDAISLHESCSDEYMKLKRRRKHRWVVFRIDDKSVPSPAALPPSPARAG